ncbi:MAG: ABC transporter permease [Tannerellaceae bacterium]
MIKNIFTQILNERKQNVYLLIELFIAGIVLWFLVDFMYIKVKTYQLATGFDIEDTYMLAMNRIPESSARFHPAHAETQKEDLQQMLKFLNTLPDVEAASISLLAQPYSRGNRIDRLNNVNDTTVSVSAQRTYISPEYFKVFAIKGANGETPEEMSAKFQLNGSKSFFTVANLLQRMKSGSKDVAAYLNTNFSSTNLGSEYYELTGIVTPLKYKDFDTHYPRYIFLPVSTELDNEAPEFLEWSLRVKSGKADAFINYFKTEIVGKYRQGNFMFSDIIPMSKNREIMMREDDLKFKNYLIGIGFLLLNIFLGILGIFWIRTQQRRSEIALHKALGASKVTVLKRLMLEGLVMLSIATICTLPFIYTIYVAEIPQSFYGVYLSFGRFASTVGITYLLMLVMIVVGIGIPAWRAMQIEPAEALHEE